MLHAGVTPFFKKPFRSCYKSWKSENVSQCRCFVNFSCGDAVFLCVSLDKSKFLPNPTHWTSQVAHRYGAALSSGFCSMKRLGLQQFIMLCKVILTFESVDEILKCDHSNESY